MSGAAEKEKKGMNARSLFLLSFLAVAVLVCVVAWFYHGSEKARESLDRARDEYDKMTAMKKNIDATRQKSGGKKTSVAPEDGSGIGGFLEKKGREQQITSLSIRPPDRETPWTGWVESAYQVSVRKEAGVARGAWVNFLASIERDRPYLKTRQIDVSFDENGTVAGSVTVSFFKPTGK